MAHVLCFANNKGGVSKTTSVWNVGVGFANKKKKTLLIDLDPQYNLTDFLGVEPTKAGTYDVLVNQSDIKPVEINKYLHILPSCLELDFVAGMITDVFKKEFILAKKVEQIQDEYDYILIDTPPSTQILTVNGLMAADNYVVPLQAEAGAIKGLSKLVAKMQTMEVTIDHILFTQYQGKTNLHNNNIKRIKKQFPGKVLNTIIRRDIKLGETTDFNEDVYSYAPKTKGAEDYNKLTKELYKIYN